MIIIRGDAAHRKLVRDRLLSRAFIDPLGPVSVDGAPCWLWAPEGLRNGYGQFSVGKQKGLLAHRVSYELFKEPIPDGLTVDHLCHPGDGSCPPDTCPHRRCINPAHLEAVTQRINTLRGNTAGAINAAKEVCINGHELSGENLYVSPKGARYCRTCQRAKWRRLDREAREAAGPKQPKARCKRGHLFDAANTYVKPNGGRDCRKCMIIREQERRARKAA